MAETSQGGAKPPEPSKAAGPELVTAHVAPGRSVVIGGGPVHATLENGKRVVVDHRTGTRFGPHEEVRLPASEVKRLRLTGALVDPEKVAKAAGSSAVVRR